jgi:hypothetical protein
VLDRLEQLTCAQFVLGAGTRERVHVLQASGERIAAALELLEAE